MAKRLWGIDLGGTKIEGVVLDPSHPSHPHCRLRVPTEASRGYDHILSQIVRLVEQMEEAVGSRRPPKIGMGTPGATEPSTGLLKNSNTTCLNGRPLRADAARALGVEILTANDANCFALAEALLGAGRGYDPVLGLILGTGVGGGIVVGGRVLEGLHGIAGEWGHNPLPGETAPCYCGRRGCVETVIAGPALERFYESCGGRRLPLRDIASRAGEDPAAHAAMQRLIQKFGQALAAVLNILDPAAVVIGGGVGNISALYSDEARQAICAYLFNPELRTPLLRPALGDSAGVFGAALLTLHANEGPGRF